MAGFIKLHRCILHKAIWKNNNLWRVWSWCLMKAVWTECESVVGMTKVQLVPGQFIYGRLKASEECGLPISTIRNCMEWLKKNESLDIKTTNKYSVVTVINWALYQFNGEEQDSNSEKNRTTTGQQQDTYKNTNKPKKGNKDSSTPKKRTIVDDYHDLFLAKYNAKPAITGKVATLLNGDVKQLGYDEVVGRLKMFFDDKDKFVADSRHDVSVFHSRINRYVVVEDENDPNSEYQKRLKRELAESRRVTW